ncbi:hypothetical protein [Azospirillum sp. SYSU D00513]|uniref:hypothetical protein n=1 Tax=Azospirillum sp. SYSU D00513 TaxID=2812561 RepID=UPI001A9712B8|nr:hypothetical protein [Azospirillum sp. SYSU D00513]
MEPMDTGARAQFTREDIRKKVITLRRLREERLLIRPQSAPHLRRLLDERIETVTRELANALPNASAAAPGSAPPIPLPSSEKRRRLEARAVERPS